MTLAEAKRAYESDRDLLKWIDNQAGETRISKYRYPVDDLGRRTAAIMIGSAFSGGSGDHHWDFGYNDRSELTDGNRRTGTTAGSGTDFGTNGVFDYAYDTIGNRSSTVVDSTTRYYCTDEDAVSGQSVNKYVTIDDESSCPPQSAEESFDYDDDGNLTADDTFTYVWDGENRLIEVVPDSPSTDDKKLEFAYDYLGRRVRKEVYVYDSGWPGEPDEVYHFVYDGWNVVMVLDDSDDENDTLRKYTWGLDLSGLSGQSPERERGVYGIHGAGGIGGLLAVVETQGTSSTADDKSYWFLYDGNGNVGQVLDATDHDPVTDMRIAAHYEYDPYGNTIVLNNDLREIDGDLVTSDGGYANVNPIRFSTKYLDSELTSGQEGAVGETGLYYYGYRFYSPTLGRWINRDPIEEVGGFNLYGVGGNAMIIRVDPHGARTSPPVTEPILPPEPIIIPTPKPGLGCVVEEVGEKCMTCCSHIIGAVVVLLCNPTPCGRGDVLTQREMNLCQHGDRFDEEDCELAQDLCWWYCWNAYDNLFFPREYEDCMNKCDFYERICLENLARGGPWPRPKWEGWPSDPPPPGGPPVDAIWD